MAFEVGLAVKGDVTVALWFTDHASEVRGGVARGLVCRLGARGAYPGRAPCCCHIGLCCRLSACCT